MEKNNNKSLPSVAFLGAVAVAFMAGIAATMPGLTGIAVPGTLIGTLVILTYVRSRRLLGKGAAERAPWHAAHAAGPPGVDQGIAVLDGQFRIVEANDILLRAFGCSAQEVMNADLPRWLASAAQRYAFRRIGAALRRHGRWRGNASLRSRSGEAFLAAVDIRRISGAIGEPLRFVAVISTLRGVDGCIEPGCRSERQEVLSHLPNRAHFVQELECRLATRRKDALLAVLLLDIAGFKRINETFGREGGDRVLRSIGKRIRRHLRAADLLAHAGGDVFLVLADGLTERGDAAAIAQKLLDGLCETLSVTNQELRLSAHVGISLFPGDAERAEQLVQCAESALHGAKEGGSDSFRFFSRESRDDAVDRLRLEMALWRAIERNEFRLRYQWQVELESRKVVGVEALLRWYPTEVGSVPPDRFIPLAEASGNIVPIGEWVLRTACRQARAWIDQGGDVGRLAVNVARKQLVHPGFEAMVSRVLDETHFPPECLELEVTESSLISHDDSAVATLARVRERGVAVAIDDFGTGYSSLSYLNRLPVDTVKIDRSFVKELPGDATAASVVEAVIALGRNLGLRVVAEGIEREAQESFLRANGCLHGQGFLYGAPMAADKIGLPALSR